ncbi:MAG: hypothetical protein P8I98_04750 [Nitrospinaceae bacterium]|nr:hypothetical protein [Nitrospinaceae bacterium]
MKHLFKKEFQIILGLIIFAAALRIPTLGSPLIEDEAISFNRYIDVPWQKLIFFYQDTNQHTLFLLISKFFIWVFGETEIIYRLPSFLFGVLSIPLMYRLGLVMKFSRSAAVLAALLMTLSWPHLKYSMEARGYGITIFLVLLVIFSAIQLLNNSRWVWGGVLIGSGFAITMALPSNLFFLGSLTIFTIMGGWFESEKNRLNLKRLFWIAIPQLIMFALIAVYFLVIYEQLKYGKDIQPQSLDGKKIFEITELLVAPWGFFIYLFFTIGAWRLKEVRERIIFASVFLIPMILTVITGALGYARIYIYWLPFIFLLSAYGMTEVIVWLKNKTGKLVYGLGVGVIFFLVFLPAKKINEYFESRNNGSLVVAGPNVTMSEAAKMAVWVNENISKNNLIVISVGGPESSVLNKYMNKKVLERMTYFSRGGILEKIIFIAHQDMPPDEYPFIPMVQERILRLPSSLVNKIHSIGNLGVYELNLKVEKLIPPTFDPDYEGKIGNANISKVNIRQVETPRVLGKKALHIENNSGNSMDIISPVVKGVDITEDHAYLLYVFITDFQPFKNVSVHLAEKGNWPPSLGYLNPLLGIFTVKGQDTVWNIFYSLSPLSKGRHFFQERIGIQKGNNYYDGLQSYLLTQ